MMFKSMQRSEKHITNEVAMKNEMTRLLVHGTLHALGYNDTEPLNKKKMFAVQERYVKRLSLKK